MSSDGTTRCGKGSDASSERACLFPSPMRCTNCVCDSFYMTTIILWLSPTIEPLPISLSFQTGRRVESIPSDGRSHEGSDILRRGSWRRPQVLPTHRGESLLGKHAEVLSGALNFFSTASQLNGA